VTLEPLLIGGRIVLPRVEVLSGGLRVDVALSMSEPDELLGAVIEVEVRAGNEILARASGPPANVRLPYASTGAITAHATFAFDNPRNLVPTLVTITVERASATFDLSDIVPFAAPPVPQGVKTFTVALLRPDDLLSLDIEAVNLDLDAADPASPALVATEGREALLVIRFPPQTIAETAFYESGGTEQKTDAATDTPRRDTPPAITPPLAPPGDVAARMSGATRLVFRVPAGTRIPFTTAGLLDWSRLELAVAPVADVLPNADPPPQALAIRAPGVYETVIELPYRLHLSPTHEATWQHAGDAVSHGGRVELWHTRLATRASAAAAEHPEAQPLRAIWSPDYNPRSPPAPGDLSPLGTIAAMSASDRHQIVVLTSAFRGYAADPYTAFVPQPIQATLLMLSPLGGWLRSFGMWDPPYAIVPRFRPEAVVAPEDVLERFRVATRPAARRETPRMFRGEQISRFVDRPDRDPTLILGRPDFVLPPRYVLGTQLDLSQWAHIAAQGRDHYVRIVYEGRLKELGHRASLVKVTERRFEAAPGTGAPVAYLRQYMYLVVREPEKDYTREALAHDGRAMPLKKIRLTTLVTPKLDYPYPDEANNPTNDPTKPNYNPASITSRSFWVMVGGKDFLFHGIAEDVVGNRIDFAKPLVFVPNSEQDLARVQQAFNALANRERRAASIPGQKVTLAPSQAGNENTSFVAVSLNFENEGVTRDAFFKPKLFKGDIRIPAVEQIAGTNNPTTIRFAQRYLDNGFADADNKTDLFAEVVKQNAAGALEMAGLDVAFTAEQAGGFATPNLAVTSLTSALGPLAGDVGKALANEFDPTSVFKKGLATLFGVFDLADLLPAGSADKNAPKMEVRREGTAVITELDWTSTVQPPPLPPAIVSFHEHDDTRLQVHGEFRKDVAAPANDTFKLRGELNHFDIAFFNALQVNFSRFTFEAQTGRKTDVNVKLDDAAPVEFKGDLEFVEGLRRLIPPGVFGDGVSIDLIQNPLGVKAGLALSLPPASVGVFSLTNISLSAGLTIPFLDGKPIVEFGFARRDNPFLLAIALLGGGGFFHIELDTGGMRMLEAAFEFGALAAIDLGVASGEVHIMAGIYFKMEKKASPSFGNTEVMMSQLSGYLRCGGKLSVLGLVSVSVEFYLCFAYMTAPKKAAYGRATLTVCVEVACFSKSVELTVERSFGSEGGDPTFGQLMDTPQAWALYANAYA
jgi:hypothetical protein